MNREIRVSIILFVVLIPLCIVAVTTERSRHKPVPVHEDFLETLSGLRKNDMLIGDSSNSGEMPLVIYVLANDPESEKLTIAFGESLHGTHYPYSYIYKILTNCSDTTWRLSLLSERFAQVELKLSAM